MANCVVTREDETGASRIAADSEIFLQTIGGRFQFAHLWGSDHVPSFPQNGAPPDYDSLFPGPGGYRFVVMQILPENESATEHAAGTNPLSGERFAEAGISEIAEGGVPGMHRTDSVDLGVVVSGTLSMELDSGERKDFQAGDTFVQNGTNHKWSNRGVIPVVAIVTMIGGQPRA